ncbi:MAG: transglutaminase-like domain-containing protein [Planctomycetes bacterium]|nr:transglutaminase-like domain-containing protein [Planctomycetota bacterium]
MPTSLRPSRTRLSALIELLDDDSPTVGREVLRELDRLGRLGRVAVERASRSGAARLRPRARRMRLLLARLAQARRLAKYATRKDIDLERAFWLLSRFDDPTLDVRPFMLALDAMAAEVLRRIEALPATHERVLELAKYLGPELGYRGEQEDYHATDNALLHRAIVEKRGLPLTLCALYVLVARRAGVRAGIVPLPGHVMLRLYGGDKHVIVDPFHEGKVRSERELLKFLAEHGLAFQPTWFRDADDRAMFARHVQNLKTAYTRRGLHQEARMLELVLDALERSGLKLRRV